MLWYAKCIRIHFASTSDLLHLLHCKVDPLKAINITAIIDFLVNNF